jgi:hypothetical protein
MGAFFTLAQENHNDSHILLNVQKKQIVYYTMEKLKNPSTTEQNQSSLSISSRVDSVQGLQEILCYIPDRKLYSFQRLRHTVVSLCGCGKRENGKMLFRRYCVE